MPRKKKSDQDKTENLDSPDKASSIHEFMDTVKSIIKKNAEDTLLGKSEDSEGTWYVSSYYVNDKNGARLITSKEFKESEPEMTGKEFADAFCDAIEGKSGIVKWH